MLSAIVFLPALGALVAVLFPNQRVRQVAAAVTLADLALAVALWTSFDAGSSTIQFAERHLWVPGMNIHYYLGVDGLNLPMVLLTAFLGFLAVLVSWNITHRVKLYFVSLLALQT